LRWAISKRGSDPYATGLSSERTQLQARREAVYGSIQPNIFAVIQAVDARDDTAIEQALSVLNTDCAVLFVLTQI
jgi:hypothetical protein